MFDLYPSCALSPAPLLAGCYTSLRSDGKLQVTLTLETITSAPDSALQTSISGNFSFQLLTGKNWFAIHRSGTCLCEEMKYLNWMFLHLTSLMTTAEIRRKPSALNSFKHSCLGRVFLVLLCLSAFS